MEVPQKKLNDGTLIPMLGFGTWKLLGDACIQAVTEALKIGYRHIDTAHAYENHHEIAKAIKEWPREELFLTTKLWRDSHDPKFVEKACDQSLQELGTDYVDLYLIHWPERKKTFAEIVHEMHRLKEKGKVRSVGLCNATIHHIQDLYNQKLEISMNQVEMHPFFSQNQLVKFCLTHNIGITAYSPLARGKVYKTPVLEEIAKECGKTAGSVALRWLIQKDVIAIPKASSKPHMLENFEIFDFKLTDEQMKMIETLNTDERLIITDFQEFDY